MNLDDMLIDENITILQAMQKLDRTAKKILFVVRKNKLVAAVTDGDIRRWILSNGNLEAAISSAANYAPKYIRQNQTNEVIQYMRDNEIEAVPVVDKEMQIVDIKFENERIDCKKVSASLAGIPVVIMAGGLGTRLYPYTKILPKPLIPVGDLPIIEHIINEFRQYGCVDFHLIVNHKKNMIKAYFNEKELDYNLSYADEDIPLGTGGGLSLLKGRIDSTFILSNCDILIKEDIEKIYKLHKQKGNLITMVCSVKNFTIPYGIVEIDSNGDIEEMKEKPSLSFLTNTGCYIVEPEIIEDLETNVAIGFPDIIDRYRKQGRRVGIYPISENSWLDMGQMDELKRMETMISEKK